MNYLYRKIRSVFYLLLNIVIFLLLFPFKKESNLKINSQLKRDEVINYLLNKMFQKNGKYLEIGCDLNQTFSKIDNNNKTGIDPVRGGNLKLSSKEFFENYNKEFFDVVFIDGSHLIEDVYYDTVQAMKNLNLGGYILLDDVLPNNNLTTFRKRMTLHSFQDAYKKDSSLEKPYNIKIFTTFERKNKIKHIYVTDQAIGLSGDEMEEKLLQFLNLIDILE